MVVVVVVATDDFAILKFRKLILLALDVENEWVRTVAVVGGYDVVIVIAVVVLRRFEQQTAL